MLLISGTKGKRFITKHSSVMIHELMMEDFNGKLKDMNNELVESRKIQTTLNNLILNYTQIDKEYLQTIMSKDSYFNAKECLNLGIVDHIINKPEDFYSRIKL
jgi:ATP-dependent Clp protease protease subunit